MSSSPHPLKVTYRPTPHSSPPPHHVLPTRSSWLPGFSTPPPQSKAPIAFRNPWPSFRKRTVWDFVVPLRWDRPTEPPVPQVGEAPENVSAGEQRVEHEMVQAREERKEKERGRKRLSTLRTNLRQGSGEGDGVERERGRIRRALSSASFRKLSVGPGPVLPSGANISPDSDSELLKEPRERGRLRRALSNTSFSRKNSTLSLPSTPPSGGPEDDEQLQIKVVQPDFGGPWDPTRSEARATWLGHAGVMLQLPPLGRKGARMDRPVRVLFDPIFSSRCSPTQYVGPARYAPAPCAVAALPEIDCIFISHNHYDHLDTDTITQLYTLNSPRVQFFVPLGLKPWFLALSIPPSQITEMDWWDSAVITYPFLPPAGTQLRVTCTPAQHGSSRYGYDADTTLWCSWVVEHVEPGEAGVQGSVEETGKEKVFRAFFAGDTGLRYTDDWEDAPRVSSSTASSSTSVSISPSPSNSSPESPILTTSPTSLLPPTASLPPLVSLPPPPTRAPIPPCPIFADLCTTLGPPDISFLPISVGASLSYLRSYSPFPTAPLIPPVHLSKSFTSAIHMEAPDAVEVHGTFAAAAAASGGAEKAGKRGPVSVGIHFGTWCGGEEEVRGVVRELRRACEERGVRFTRALTHAEEEGRGGAGAGGKFVVVNHGETIRMGF